MPSTQAEIAAYHDAQSAARGAGGPLPGHDRRWRAQAEVGIAGARLDADEITVVAQGRCCDAQIAPSLKAAHAQHGRRHEIEVEVTGCTDHWCLYRARGPSLGEAGQLGKVEIAPGVDLSFVDHCRHIHHRAAVARRRSQDEGIPAQIAQPVGDDVEAAAPLQHAAIPVDHLVGDDAHRLAGHQALVDEIQVSATRGHTQTASADDHRTRAIGDTPCAGGTEPDTTLCLDRTGIVHGGGKAQAHVAIGHDGTLRAKGNVLPRKIDRSPCRQSTAAEAKHPGSGHVEHGRGVRRIEGRPPRIEGVSQQ